MIYKWDNVVGAIVWGRVRAAAGFGLSSQDMRQIGRLAALKAEKSWVPGKRSVKSWVYYNVEKAVRRAMVIAARHAADDFDPEAYFDHHNSYTLAALSEDVEGSRILIREALDYLEARLSDEDWLMLWLHHAEGWNCKELADRWEVEHTVMRKRMSRARNKAVTLWRNAA